MGKTILFLLISLMITLSLVSCSLSGVDSVDYSVEEIIGRVEADGEAWGRLENMLCMLTVNSAQIPEFDSMKVSSEACRESLLNYMLAQSYDKYSGNAALIEEINELYPKYNVVCAIPQEDFESEMYRYFGGSVKIVHKSCTLFNYLPSAEVYVPVGAPVTDGVRLELTSAEETEHTYRLRFKVVAGDTVREYLAVLIKREDGTVYFDAVLAP